jgi:hypothetical protein
MYIVEEVLKTLANEVSRSKSALKALASPQITLK